MEARTALAHRWRYSPPTVSLFDVRTRAPQLARRCLSGYTKKYIGMDDWLKQVTPRVPPSSGNRVQPPVIRRRGIAPLAGSVYLNAPDGSYALFASRVLIGRGAHCRIVLRDPHVSREHACIEISRERVTVENLMSVNGVYINGRKIFGPERLYPRDRILVGTTELSVYRIDEQPRSHASHYTSRPPAGMFDVTDRDEALTVLGRVANRMFGQGRPAEAEIVLGDHLEGLLDGARSGLAVPQHMCEEASQFALMLAVNLHKAIWVEYTIELHLCTQQPLSRSTASLLEAALRNARDLNENWVIAGLATMGPYARELLRKLRSGGP
jgi:hypothetical protein